jgi:hypothetical protein
MGTISKGILGGVNGTVGTVIGGRWRGIDYLRSKSNSRRTRSTDAQDLQRAKFKLATGFLQMIRPLLHLSFKDYSSQMTGPNQALSYTLKNAIVGELPDLQIDYSLILVSKGSLPNIFEPVAVSSAPGTINFTWEDNSNIGSAKPRDKAILLAYCEEKKRPVYTMAGGERSSEKGILNVPSFSGKAAHTWIAFMNESGKEISPSIYTGLVNVM